MELNLYQKEFLKKFVAEDEFNSFNMSYEDFKYMLETNKTVTVSNRLMTIEISKHSEDNPFEDTEYAETFSNLCKTKVVSASKNCNLELDIRICNSVIGLNWRGYSTQNSLGDDFLIYNNGKGDLKDKVCGIESLYENLMVISYVIDEVIWKRKSLNNITVIINNYKQNKVYIYNKGCKGTCSFKVAKRILHHLRNDEYLFVFNSESNLSSTAIKIKEVTNDEGQKISLRYSNR